MASHPQIERQRHENALCTRMAWMALGLILGFTGISVRLYWLQVRMHDKLTAEAARLRQDRLPLPALRGSVWDSTGQLLAQDRTLTEIYADKMHLEDIKVVLPYLAKHLGTNKTALRQQMTDAQIVTAYREHVAKTIAPKLACMEADVLKILQPGDLKAPTLINGLEKEEGDAWTALLRDNFITGVYLRPYVRAARGHRRIITGIRMRQHPMRLVHHDEVLVLEQDVRRH